MCLGPRCAEQGQPGVDMGRLWSPEDDGLSSSCVPGTLANFSTAPTLGFPQTNGRARRGSVWGLAAWTATVHRGPGGCTLDHGPPTLDVAVFEPKVAMHNPQVNREHRGGADFEGHTSVCMCLPGPRAPGPECRAWFTQGLGLKLPTCALVSWCPLP